MSELAMTNSFISAHRLADARKALGNAQTIARHLDVMQTDENNAYHETQRRLEMAEREDALRQAGEAVQQAEDVLHANEGLCVSFKHLSAVDALIVASNALLDSVIAADKAHSAKCDNEKLGAVERTPSAGEGHSVHQTAEGTREKPGNKRENLSEDVADLLSRLRAIEAQREDALTRSHAAQAEAGVHEHVNRGEYKAAREAVVKYTEEMSKSGVKGCDVIGQRLLEMIESAEHRSRAVKCLQDASAAIERHALGEARAFLEAALESFGHAGGLREEDFARVQDVKDGILRGEGMSEYVKQGDQCVSEAETALTESEFDAATQMAQQAREMYTAAGWTQTDVDRVVKGLTSRVDAARRKSKFREEGAMHLANTQAALGAANLDEAESELAKAAQAYRYVPYFILFIYIYIYIYITKFLHAYTHTYM